MIVPESSVSQAERGASADIVLHHSIPLSYLVEAEPSLWLALATFLAIDTLAKTAPDEVDFP